MAGIAAPHMLSMIPAIGYVITEMGSHFGAGNKLENETYQRTCQTWFRTQGTLSNLWVRVVANTVGATGVDIDLAIRTTFGPLIGWGAPFSNQTINVPTLTTGVFEDNINTDAIPSGGTYVAYHLTKSAAGTFTTSLVQFLFTSATNNERVYRCSNSGNFSGYFTGFGEGYHGLMGLYASGAEVGSLDFPWQMFMPVGTFRNAALHARTNTRNGDCTLTLRVNGADTTITVTLPALLSGKVEDITHTVVTAYGDLANWYKLIGGSSGIVSDEGSEIDFVTTGAFFSGGTKAASGINLSAGTCGSVVPCDGFGAMSGHHDQTQTELQVQATALVADTWNGIHITVPQNGQADTVTFRSRINGINGNQLLTVPALTTGYFVSSGLLIDTINIGDEINIRRQTTAVADATAFLYYTHSIFSVTGTPDPPDPPPEPVPGSIYILVESKKNDTLVIDLDPYTEEDRAIPDPFGDTAFLGE